MALCCLVGNNSFPEPMLTQIDFAYDISRPQWVNRLRPRQNGCHFADSTFKCIFLNENVIISIKISLNFILKGLINNIPALVQIMAWCKSSEKPLNEPMMVSLLTHVCVIWPQWVNSWQWGLNIRLVFCRWHFQMCLNFWNGQLCILVKISLKILPKGVIDNNFL